MLIRGLFPLEGEISSGFPKANLLYILWLDFRTGFHIRRGLSEQIP